MLKDDDLKKFKDFMDTVFRDPSLVNCIVLGVQVGPNNASTLRLGNIMTASGLIRTMTIQTDLDLERPYREGMEDPDDDRIVPFGGN